MSASLTRTVPLPSDPKVTATIKRLGWFAKKAARDIEVKRSTQELVAMGGAAFLRSWREINEERASDRPKADAPAVAATDGEEASPVVVAPDVAAAVADPANLYDWLTTLTNGIKSWTKPEPVSPEAIKELEEVDAEFLVRQILEMTLPAPKTEEQEKNASSPFTAA